MLKSHKSNNSYSYSSFSVNKIRNLILTTLTALTDCYAGYLIAQIFNYTVNIYLIYNSILGINIQITLLYQLINCEIHKAS